MFKKILIANRGEIACRVARTARKMGIATVAVYSEADARALHVREADEAVPIGPAPAAQSYLVIERIVDACRETGADAVHPGYGFLSENAAFARALGERGIAFIGPNVGAIEAMGDKIESKKFADRAGVATVPGHLGVIDDEKEAVRIAGAIGYPVMIKASAGGGGKGMRVVRGPGEVAEGFRLARSEARSSFGDDRVFLEKFIVRPRHIEIQVLGDKHGHAIHLGERECSIQRRNQKVVEEAPSPFLDARTRRAMGEQAVALAKAVGYDSAGTVEFMVDADRQFYFLEMNTRLQVEHPVTELVTGIDLVEQMIRIAAGEALAIRQRDVKLGGWAIESRVYAEDPQRDFLPSTGRLVRYRPPPQGTDGAGRTIRNDTGVFEGGEISVYYDPMIAKLCTHAPDRGAATQLMADALDTFTIEGIRHNIAFLSAIMQHPRWASGELSTGFIAEEFPGGFHGVPSDPATTATLVIVAAALDHADNSRKRRISGQMRGTRVQFARERVVKLDADWHAVTIGEETEHAVAIRRQTGAGDSKAHVVESAWQPGEALWRGLVDSRPASVQVRRILNGYRLAHRGAEVSAWVYTTREAELARLMPAVAAAGSAKQLLCPMPGLVVSIAVAEGQEIKAGEPLCTVEAMKMENVLRAERDATVGKIHVKKGDSLAVDSVIMEFA